MHCKNCKLGELVYIKNEDDDDLWGLSCYHECVLCGKKVDSITANQKIEEELNEKILY